MERLKSEVKNYLALLKQMRSREFIITLDPTTEIILSC